jgi:hypothetical protein
VRRTSSADSLSVRNTIATIVRVSSDRLEAAPSAIADSISTST